MRKLERIVDTVLNTQETKTALVVGGDMNIFDYLSARVDNVVTNFEFDDSFELIVVAGPDMSSEDIKRVPHIFGNTTTVIVEETEGGGLRRRNTGPIHISSFGEFVYLTDDGPHIILYSRDPYVVRDVSNYTPTTPTPTTTAPVITTTAPEVEDTVEDEDFESGIDKIPNPPSYYWKPSQRGTE